MDTPWIRSACAAAGTGTADGTVAGAEAASVKRRKTKLKERRGRVNEKASHARDQWDSCPPPASHGPALMEHNQGASWLRPPGSGGRGAPSLTPWVHTSLRPSPPTDSTRASDGVLMRPPLPRPLPQAVPPVLQSLMTISGRSPFPLPRHPASPPLLQLPDQRAMAQCRAAGPARFPPPQTHPLPTLVSGAGAPLVGGERASHFAGLGLGVARGHGGMFPPPVATGSELAVAAFAAAMQAQARAQAQAQAQVQEDARGSSRQETELADSGKKGKRKRKIKDGMEALLAEGASPLLVQALSSSSAGPGSRAAGLCALGAQAGVIEALRSLEQGKRGPISSRTLVNLLAKIVRHASDAGAVSEPGGSGDSGSEGEGEEEGGNGQDAEEEVGEESEGGLHTPHAGGGPEVHHVNAGLDSEGWPQRRSGSEEPRGWGAEALRPLSPESGSEGRGPAWGFSDDDPGERVGKRGRRQSSWYTGCHGRGREGAHGGADGAPVVDLAMGSPEEEEEEVVEEGEEVVEMEEEVEEAEEVEEEEEEEIEEEEGTASVPGTGPGSSPYVAHRSHTPLTASTMARPATESEREEGLEGTVLALPTLVSTHRGASAGAPFPAGLLDDPQTLPHNTTLESGSGAPSVTVRTSAGVPGPLAEETPLEERAEVVRAFVHDMLPHLCSRCQQVVTEGVPLRGDPGAIQGSARGSEGAGEDASLSLHNASLQTAPLPLSAHCLDSLALGCSVPPSSLRSLHMEVDSLRALLLKKEGEIWQLRAQLQMRGAGGAEAGGLYTGTYSRNEP